MDCAIPRFDRCLRSAALLALVVGCTGLFVSAARAETYAWLDADGVTHLTDDPDGVPPAHRDLAAGDVDRLRELWQNEILGAEISTPPGTSGRDGDRYLRLLRGAVDDLRRGETARAGATLRSVRRMWPGRAEAYWYLALLDRRRGRYERAHQHLMQFQERAGEDLADWRKRAQELDHELLDERRLTDVDVERPPLQFTRVRTPNFHLDLDSELGRVDHDYASTVLGFLEEARQEVSNQVGVAPLEPLGVLLYGKAAYLQAHRHRFSFQTVGFFDGRIHVTSPAHPSESMRSLLYHEYTHAVFREQTGGDRPYWLNEGLAERMERRSRKLEPSTRSERFSLRTRIEAGNWIPLRQIAPSFSGLSDEDARAAYLESVVATAYIESRTTSRQRAQMLGRIGEGYSVDQALHEAMGMDTEHLDEAVRRSILEEFPATSGGTGSL